MITRIEVEGALKIVVAIADCIRELKQVPAGHLYALLMPKMSLAQFEQAIALLVKTDQITREGEELIWKGGAA